MPLLSRLFTGDRRSPVELPYPPASPEGLAARWVRWVAGIGPMHNPIGDTTGADAGLNQPDDVWFLAGTFGDDVERRCNVPTDRPLFLPVFNMWHVPADGPPQPLPRRSAVWQWTGNRLSSTPSPRRYPSPRSVGQGRRRP